MVADISSSTQTRARIVPLIRVPLAIQRLKSAPSPMVAVTILSQQESPMAASLPIANHVIRLIRKLVGMEEPSKKFLIPVGGKVTAKAVINTNTNVGIPAGPGQIITVSFRDLFLEAGP